MPSSWPRASLAVAIPDVARVPHLHDRGATSRPGLPMTGPGQPAKRSLDHARSHPPTAILIVLDCHSIRPAQIRGTRPGRFICHGTNALFLVAPWDIQKPTDRRFRAADYCRIGAGQRAHNKRFGAHRLSCWSRLGPAEMRSSRPARGCGQSCSVGMIHSSPMAVWRGRVTM